LYIHDVWLDHLPSLLTHPLHGLVPSESPTSFAEILTAKSLEKPRHEEMGKKRSVVSPKTTISVNAASDVLMDWRKVAELESNSNT